MKTVLVVDDDKDMVLMITKMLESNDYQVYSAEDGARALQQTNLHHIDLILLDNRMPLLSGIFYCNALKRKPNTKNIPVVLVSGGLDEETIFRGREAGAVDFLKKPFHMDDLLKIVSRHAGEA